MDSTLLAGGADEDVTAQWTRADLDRFPEDGHRRELVDGHLLVSPLARARHQVVVAKITTALELWSREHHGTAFPGVNVDLAEDTHMEPDVAWASSVDMEALGYDHTPEIVVEVGSPSTHRHDRGPKRERYLASGAVEVWLVDLERDEIEVHRSDVPEPVVFGRDDTLTSAVLPGFSVPVGDLLPR